MYRVRNKTPLLPVLAELRNARNYKGMSQVMLAEASGAGRVTIARLEAGTEQDFRISTLTCICAALDLEGAALPGAAQSASPATDTAVARERARTQRLGCQAPARGPCRRPACAGVSGSRARFGPSRRTRRPLRSRSRQESGMFTSAVAPARQMPENALLPHCANPETLCPERSPSPSTKPTTC